MACSGRSGVVSLHQGPRCTLLIIRRSIESVLNEQGLLCPGALLCVLGFVSAIIVSALDKIGMRQLGLDGTIQEESRKVV